MTEKNVKCADCKFCDQNCWCRIKDRQVAVMSVRSCKIYARQEPSRE